MICDSEPNDRRGQVVAERTLNPRKYPWERTSEPQRPANSARRDIPVLPETRRMPRTAPADGQEHEGRSVLSHLPELLREASEAINAAEARAVVIEQRMAEAVRAAEDRARAAEELAAMMEQRAMEAIRAAEDRAESAERRLHAAEEWVARLREMLQQSF